MELKFGINNTVASRPVTNTSRICANTILQFNRKRCGEGKGRGEKGEKRGRRKGVTEEERKRKEGERKGCKKGEGDQMELQIMRHL